MSLAVVELPENAEFRIAYEAHLSENPIRFRVRYIKEILTGQKIRYIRIIKVVRDRSCMRTFDLAQSNSGFTADELARSNIQTESVLESMLHANPQAILDEEIFIFGRQTGVETGILDLLALDQCGNLLVIELKVGQSGSGSASEETILSQPQNYAQSLESYTYDQLEDIYQGYRDDIQSDRWAVSDAAVPAGDLQSAFESVFGEKLEADEFNPDQRMVIVAEGVSRRTESNARYLIDQGLNIQCIEIQRFTSDISDHTVLGTNTVVDYHLSRVRPDRQLNPIYPDVVRDLVERIFPEIQSVVKVNTSEAAFQDIESHRPHLRSKHPDHPDDLVYTLYLRPVEWGYVIVAMDYWGEDDEPLNTLRQNAELFNERGFQISQDRTRDRIVRTNWEVDSTDVLSDETFLTEVAEEFVNLVKTGHEVFTGDGQ